ncbi:hypothetical protein L2E82_45807 [Cichorium intybus]|uniref:Uncharacterized protein n=1 Tax=Cichorium intybus TaxID=13427 RepID=A0ACB8ZUW1_CICIN|nr:hypothetical protein L2E82_45807 [Cichorium intybus]
MGAAESTGRSNETEREDEERRQESNGGSTGAAAAITMAAAGAAVAAWGLSRMLSDSKDNEENNEAMSIQAPVVTNNHGEPRPYNRRILYRPPSFVLKNPFLNLTPLLLSNGSTMMKDYIVVAPQSSRIARISSKSASALS